MYVKDVKPAKKRVEMRRIIVPLIVIFCLAELYFTRKREKAYLLDMHSISTQQDSFGQKNGIEMEELGVSKTEEL